MPGRVLGWLVLNTSREGCLITPILQMRKVRLRSFQWLRLSHTPGKVLEPGFKLLLPWLQNLCSPLPPCLSLPINRSPPGLSLFSRTPRGLLNVTHFFLVLLGHCDQTPAQWFSPRKHVGTWEGWKRWGLHQSYTGLQSPPVKSESLRAGPRERGHKAHR